MTQKNASIENSIRKLTAYKPVLVLGGSKPVLINNVG